MNKFKQTVCAFPMALLLSGVAHSPVNAVTVNFQKDNQLVNIFEQVTSQFNSLQNYVSSILADKIEPLAESLNADLQAAIDEAVGALGLPDPTASRNKVEQIAADSDVAVNHSEIATNEIERQITRAVADSTLSRVGQKRQKQQLETTQHSVSQVQQHARAAQGEVVTQNVMKHLAQQNVKTAAILGTMRADGLKLQQSQDLANVNLTNISRSLDGQNQVRQRQTVGQGFSNLRTAAQARLF